MVHKDYTCMHEELVQDHSLKIKGLEARANFNDQRLTNVESQMKEMNDKLEKLNQSIITSQKETVETIKNLQLQSNQDDYNIDKRVTSLETTVRVLKWIIAVAISILSVLIALNIIN